MIFFNYFLFKFLYDVENDKFDILINRHFFAFNHTYSILLKIEKKYCSSFGEKLFNDLNFQKLPEIQKC